MKIVVVGHGTNHGFNSFFAHLLRNFTNAFIEQRCGVRPFGHLLLALIDEVLQMLQEHDIIHLVGFVPTGIGTGVAGWAHGIGLYQQGIVVAVHGHRYHI